MTRSELITALARRFPNLMAKDAEIAVRQIIDAMAAALANGDRIEIRGFGSFAVAYRAPRRGRNPRTGETVCIDGRYAPHFRAGKEMRARVDAGAPAHDERQRKVA